MKFLLWFFLINWVFPNVLALLIAAFLVATRNANFTGVGFPYINVTFRKDCWGIFKKMWQRWSGLATFAVSWMRWDVGKKSQTERHENRHNLQFFILGLLGYVAYVAHTAFIFFFQKDKHSYLDNWFERDARRAAGQKVDIPRGEWNWGPNDRFPWL